jgi:hypothetical protein
MGHTWRLSEKLSSLSTEIGQREDSNHTETILKWDEGGLYEEISPQTPSRNTLYSLLLPFHLDLF